MAAGGLLSPPVAAKDDSDRIKSWLVQAGTWHFAATALNEAGQSECRETWTFREGGGATFISARQVIEGRWWVEIDADGVVWLRLRSLTTNAGVDCMGNLADPATYPRPERRIVLSFFDDGADPTAALTCRAPDMIRGPDGQLVQAYAPRRCWGIIQSDRLPAENRIDPSQWRMVSPQ